MPVITVLINTTSTTTETAISIGSPVCAATKTNATTQRTITNSSRLPEMPSFITTFLGQHIPWGQRI